MMLAVLKNKDILNNCHGEYWLGNIYFSSLHIYYIIVALNGLAEKSSTV